jgi:hypothetical protein
MIQKKATDAATKAMEGTRDAIAELNSTFGGDLGSKLYAKDEGGALTQEDVQAFIDQGVIDEDGKVNMTRAKKQWNNLS